MEKFDNNKTIIYRRNTFASVLYFTLHNVASSVFARSCSEGVLKDAVCVVIVPPSGTVSHKEIFGPTIIIKSHLITQFILQLQNAILGNFYNENVERREFLFLLRDE